jgi:hypothetical protein
MFGRPGRFVILFEKRYGIDQRFVAGIATNALGRSNSRRGVDPRIAPLPAMTKGGCREVRIGRRQMWKSRSQRDEVIDASGRKVGTADHHQRRLLRFT